MPSITLNRSVFEKLVGKSLPLEKLKERISMIGTDLESIEGNEIHVEVFPNRPDMLSEQGFARAFASFIGIKKGLRRYDVKSSGQKVVIDKSVGKVRPYTACAIVRGLKIDEDKIVGIIQLQEKLHVTYGRKRKKVAIGIYPYEKIVPPIRFMAKKPKDIIFRPLEFPKELNGQQILANHPTGREYGPLLEGCDVFPVFLDKNDNVLSMPPIINSHDVGKITCETTDVFIECSGFDFNVLHTCLKIIVTALADMGGSIESMELIYPEKTMTTPDLSPSKMKIDTSYINKRLGLELKEQDMKRCLEMMGFGYEKGVVAIPPYRADILHQIDLCEDIAIAYGYENFEPIIPNVATVAEESKIERLKERIAESLIGLGLLEVNTYNLASEDEQCGLMKMNVPLIHLSNSISSDYDVLRAWVIPSMIEVLAKNKHHEYPQEIFGCGTVFGKDAKEETGIIEKESIAVALTSDDVDYTRARQVLDSLMRAIGIEYSIVDAEHASFIPGRVGRILVNDKKIGYIGEIHPSVISNWKLEYPIAAFELDVSGILNLI